MVKRVAVMAALARKARMRARDDLATMFCKRAAIKVKKSRDELDEIRRHLQAIVEALVANYRTCSCRSTPAALPRKPRPGPPASWGKR